MHYLIGRDLDGDGQYEYIEDMDNMILTENPGRALQFTKTELNNMDMAYLNQYGFFAVEATNLVGYTLSRLFAPLTTSYRPRVAPPPRRPRPPIHRGPMGPVVPAPRRAPRAAAPRPVGPAPRPMGPVPRPMGPAPRPAGPAPRPAGPAPRPVGPVARPAGTPKGPGSRGGRGPAGPMGGGRGPGF